MVFGVFLDLLGYFAVYRVQTPLKVIKKASKTEVFACREREIHAFSYIFHQKEARRSLAHQTVFTHFSSKRQSIL